MFYTKLVYLKKKKITSFSAITAMPGQSTFEEHLWHNTDFTFLPSSDTREGSTDPSGEEVCLLSSMLVRKLKTKHTTDQNLTYAT